MAEQDQFGIAPAENVFGAAPKAMPLGHGGMQYADQREDAIGAIEGMVGASEIGEPRACIHQQIGNRLYRDVYKSFPYIVLGLAEPEYVRKSFELMVADARAQVDEWIHRGYTREQLVLVWRLEDKIEVKESWCRNCGGSLVIRTRYLIRPDREAFVTGSPSIEDPGYLGDVQPSE
jgi:hypothetical protein